VLHPRASRNASRSAGGAKVGLNGRRKGLIFLRSSE
jgi:hypothetical protein